MCQCYFERHKHTKGDLGFCERFPYWVVRGIANDKGLIEDVTYAKKQSYVECCIVCHSCGVGGISAS